ncbi:zinc ribbon domain-containing protein [Occallatibacter savannae]|uniref:zinc ribbon domain-containing protein n=1 Tax=Occallatibacter savannae TaxID=1002691 RepID=UPI0013A57834|nr:zinc ribbon domain-containing protein [Occallatibacter savannae]
MYCSACGFRLGSHDAFCPQCGKAVTQTVPTPPSAAIPPAAYKAIQYRHKIAFVILSVCLVAVVLWISLSVKKSPSGSSTPSPEQQNAQAGASVSPTTPQPQIVRPTVPSPKFKIYKFMTDEGISVVVPVKTTDEQLKSLLWFFRDKVRSHRFKDIGLTHGTSKQWGNIGYLSGMISVYRGEKCANEPFADNIGSCGYGEHDEAYYQWGIDGDQNKDAGSIVVKGNDVQVFDYKDGWQVAPEAAASIEQGTKSEQAARDGFAQRLQQRLTSMGYDITVWAHGEGDTQEQDLVLDSDMFKDTATRVQFINGVLPSWKKDLCKVGFRTVKLRQGSVFELGQDYSLGCEHL